MVKYLKLFVCIIGVHTTSFPVKIKSSETVADLASAILKEMPRTLRGVDPNNLILYKVEISDSGPDTLQQSALQALHDSEKLEVPSEELSQLFPKKIPDGMVSIVVEVPKSRTPLRCRSLSGFQSLSSEESESGGSWSLRRPAHAGAQDIFGSMSVQREVTSAGYTIPPPLPEGWSLFTTLKPTMSQATSQSGISVVLKTIRDSNERRLLQYLSGIKAPSNHTIPLLDVIDLSIGETIIVLPWESSLVNVLRFRHHPDDVVSLCLQFIEGVAFLHQHKVAHLDLKPLNVVVGAKSESLPRLFIIDFDVAEDVESEETMIEGFRGTRGWTAPELGSEDGPDCQYSPILADRWSSGRMIEYFADYFPADEDARKTTLLPFAKRLLDSDPRARPALSELPPAIHRPTKRKLSTSQEEPVPKCCAGLKPQMTE